MGAHTHTQTHRHSHTHTCDTDRQERVEGTKNLFPKFLHQLGFFPHYYFFFFFFLERARFTKKRARPLRVKASLLLPLGALGPEVVPLLLLLFLLCLESRVARAWFVRESEVGCGGGKANDMKIFVLNSTKIVSVWTKAK